MLAVLVGFPALHVTALQAVVVVGGVQAGVAGAAGPVHLVDHLLRQADCLLATLHSSRDLSSLGELELNSLVETLQLNI